MELFEADDDIRKSILKEIEERKKENIEHKKMFVKMFMKEIGVDSDYSDVDIYISEHNYTKYNVSITLHAELDIQFGYMFAISHVDSFYALTLITKNVNYINISHGTQTNGDISILDDKPKSKYIFDYVMKDGDKKMRLIIHDLYTLIFTTDYLQNLPKAYTFLLCCPGIIPKNVDKIIANKILF